MKNTCIFILLFLLIFTACQPTPEVEFVVTKRRERRSGRPFLNGGTRGLWL